MTDTIDERKKVAELIKDFRFAMFATRHTDGKLVAHPLTVQEAEFDGDLWFLVSKKASPVADLAADSEANVSFSSSDSWVSLSGTARLIEDRQKIEELWNPVVEAWFPDGPDDPFVGVLKFTAESAEYWDSPGGKIATAFSFVKSKLTGRQYDGGDNAKVDL
ncbi:pyridoxamine 5'-phosphate oxidase family protein [Microbacterium sp. M28]|uniref:pyridoxamine 5'-phosphate oxidase family protein n=1 Tax=Microbacterium sp. M28 TaxID=2962064 RepID=UPI0021F44F13|nr:pyridoxamine 5'-phosphate oxidase family protein [Microbacterium sp. M28]UYO96903.1 pyridoxamine 5'-phosphate oxidase family protein [Microbacterium sp. M28]